MNQHECANIQQVANKVAELTNTLPDRETWKYYCNELKKNKRTSDTVDTQMVTETILQYYSDMTEKVGM